MPSTPNPIAPLARTLSVLLAVFIGVQVFNLAFEAWTHYSLKLLMSGN